MADIKNKIEDFGEHIGGAKKEKWSGRNITLSDLNEFDDIDVKNYVNKSKIWKTPKWEELVEQGYDKTACYFIKLMRDAFPTKPYFMTVEEGKTYTEALEKYRDRVMKVKTPEDVKRFGYDGLNEAGAIFIDGGRMKGSRYYETKMQKVIRKDFDRLKQEAMDKDFLFTDYDKIKTRYEVLDFSDRNVHIGTDQNGNMEIKHHIGSSVYFYRPNLDIDGIEQRINDAIYDAPYGVACDRKIVWTFESERDAQEFIEKVIQGTLDKLADWDKKQKEEKESKAEDKEPKGKKKFKTEPLSHIDHISPFGDAKNIVGEDFLKDFNIRGGEFGNWLNENDRQENMNAAYDAFKDLARALDIDDISIGIGKKLNIAFGARGTSRALAHYEPDREVINLTKMKGAGSLAHEYFHAIDNIYAKTFPEYSKTTHYTTEFGASGYTRLKNVSLGASSLMDAIMTKSISEEEAKEIANHNIKGKLEDFDKEVDRLCFFGGYDKLPDDKKKIVDEFREHMHELINDREKGKKVREFDFNLRNGLRGRGKWVYNKDEINYIKEIGKQIGADENLSRYAEYFLQEVDSISSQIEFIKENAGKDTKVDSQYLTDAKAIDKAYSKSGHGYWSSACELAARAFSCYIMDKLAEKGITNDYLCGHSEGDPVVLDGREVFTYPRGEEREAINKAFDHFFDEIKEKLIYNERKIEEQVVEVEKNGAPHTIALSGDTITITNKETKEQNSLKYSSPDKALSSFESVIKAEEKSIADEVLDADDIYKNFEDKEDREEGHQYSFDDYLGDDR